MIRKYSVKKKKRINCLVNLILLIRQECRSLTKKKKKTSCNCGEDLVVKKCKMCEDMPKFLIADESLVIKRDQVLRAVI